MKSNIIFAFIGGIMVGAAGAIGVMKQTGWQKLDANQRDILYAAEVEGMKSDTDDTASDISKLRDTPSFVQPKTLDTHRTDYSRSEEKPDLDEMAKKYEMEENDMENSESGDDEDEDEDDGDPDPGLGDIDVYDDDELNIEEYGHVIKQIKGRREKDLIYLIPQEWAGEVYLLEELNYYRKDDVVADLTDAPVDDPLHVIGDCLGEFGLYSDEDKVFVRNCTMGIEYEITLIDGRYADHLYGIKPEDYEDKPKKMTKNRKGRDDD